MGLCSTNKIYIILSTAFIFLLIPFATGYASSVQLQWDPNTEADLAGYKVYYGADTAPQTSSVPVDVHNQSATTITGLDPDKSYSFAVTAYNAAGQESSFSNIVTIAEQSPPTVAIISPVNNSTVSDTVSVSVSADDNVGVTKIEYYVNNVLLGADISAPYSFSWNTSSAAPGVYILTAKAYDAAGNVSQSSSSVAVSSDLIAPNVALTSPANSSILSGIVTVHASASDNVAVSGVEIYCNDILMYSSNLSPYSFNWDTHSVSSGSYAIIAMAYDNAGHATQSSPVTVTVINSLPVSASLTIADALLALQIGSGRVTATSEQMTRMDVSPVINGKSAPDGKVSSGDAIAILSKVVGKLDLQFIEIVSFH